MMRFVRQAPLCAFALMVLFSATACEDQNNKPFAPPTPPPFEQPTFTIQNNKDMAVPTIVPTTPPPAVNPFGDHKDGITIPGYRPSTPVEAPTGPGTGNGLPSIQPARQQPTPTPVPERVEPKASIKISPLDVQEIRDGRYSISKGGEDLNINASSVNCRLHPKSVFIEIASGIDRISIQIPNYSAERSSYHIPVPNELLDHGIVMYEVAGRIRYSAMDLIDKDLISHCKIDLSVGTGKINGKIDCKRLAGVSYREAADLTGNFVCPID